MTFVNYNGLKYFAKTCKRLYCYGIGKWGELITKYCKKNHINIDMYIVSKGQPLLATFYGKQVVYLDEGLVRDYDGIIIATTSLKMKNEMLYNIVRYTRSKKYYFLTLQSSVVHYYWKKFKKKVQKRKKCDIFDYYRSSYPIPYDNLLFHNLDSYLCYGISNHIKRYIKLSWREIECSVILHGVALGVVATYEGKPANGNIFAMSGYDLRRLSHVNIYSLGPYIRYVKSFLSKVKLERLKKTLGKTLIVMPTHSTPTLEEHFDRDAFFDEIERVKCQGGYQTVLVCLYCVDIMNGEYKVYKRKGYRIVSAGYMFDKRFLERLKSILLLADMVLTNGIGTHIGYAISLDKPVYHFRMMTSDQRKRELLTGKFLSINPPEDFFRIREEIVNGFCQYEESISQTQRDLIRKYWGEWNLRRGMRAYHYLPEFNEENTNESEQEPAN